MSVKYLGNSLILKIEDTPNSGNYTVVGGSVDHTYSQTSETVDVSDKDSDRWGETLTAGSRGASISMNVWVSDNAQFEIMREAWKTDTILNYEFDYGNSELVIGKFHIESMEVSGGPNTAQTSSVSFTSAEPLLHGKLTDFLLDSDSANLTDSNNQYIQGL